MRKSRIMYFLMTGVLLFLLSGGAWAYNFNDVTNVQEWQYNSVYGSWTDVIGDTNYFDTFGANLSGNIFTIFTNWHPSKEPYLTAITADLFIDNNSDGTFDYAIQLDTLSGTGKVYANPIYQTSQDLFKAIGYIYGGRFDQTNSSPVPVKTTSSDTGSTSVAWTLGNGGLNNQVAVDLSGLTLVNDWSFVWGAATCSNDAISGQVQVPESTTMLLLGLGLVGLAGARRKFQK